MPSLINICIAVIKEYGREKTFTDEQKEIFEKYHVAKSETIEYRFGRVKARKRRYYP